VGGTFRRPFRACLLGGASTQGFASLHPGLRSVAPPGRRIRGKPGLCLAHLNSCTSWLRSAALSGFVFGGASTQGFASHHPGLRSVAPPGRRRRGKPGLCLAHLNSCTFWLRSAALSGFVLGDATSQGFASLHPGALFRRFIEGFGAFTIVVGSVCLPPVVVLELLWHPLRGFCFLRFARPGIPLRSIPG